MLCVAAFGQGEVQVSQVTKDKIDQSVKIAGSIESFQASRSDRAPNSFKVKDATGEIRVCVWPDVFSQIAGHESIKNGAKVNLTGKVAEFRGAVEIHVNSASDVQVEGAAATTAAVAATTAAATSAVSTQPAAVAAAPAAAAVAPAGGVTPIAQLTSDKMSQTFTIQGEVVSARKPSTDRAPYVLKIKDASGSIDVVFWQDLADQLSDGQKVNQGDQVRITGKLNEFRGTPQLRVESSSDLKTPKTNPDLFQGQSATTTAPQPQAGVQRLPLSEIATAAVRQRVEISGSVGAVERMRLGQRVTLKDASGSVTVLLWDTAQGLTPTVNKLKGGEKLTLRGTVDTVDSTKVIVVTQPEDVTSAS
jgi:DNA/RNA endonuclease YhcR with UshA esterase domain